VRTPPRGFLQPPRNPYSHARTPRRSAVAPRRVACAALILAGTAAGVRGEGFRSPTTGATGLGNTGGRIAFIDDASAVFHNPANLVELPSWQASLQPTLVHHQVQYESPGGATQSTSDPWKILPHFFAGGPIDDDGRYALGVGLSVPFGLSIDWDPAPTDPLRYAAPRYVQLKTFNFNPSAAVRLGEKVSLGVGFDLMWSELTLSQFYPWSFVAGVPGLPDGDLRGQGTGMGYGGNAGVTWQIAPRHRLAATIRTPMDVDYEGDFRVTGAPTTPDGNIVLPFGSEIRFPTMAALGYGFQLSECVQLEADVEWLQFSRFETLPLEVPGTLPGIPGEIRQDWNDTFTAGLAATWKFAEGWRLRGSYQYFQTPVPEETYSPSIPDANQHALAVGIGYRQGRHSFDFAYSRVFYETRDITVNQNPAFLGRYEIDVHLFSAGYGLSF
jgi:long-chain fatty acid transport protein